MHSKRERDLGGALLTKAGSSRALETGFANARERSICVGAVGINVTVMGASGTLIYIWKYAK